MIFKYVLEELNDEFLDFVKFAKNGYFYMNKCKL